MFTKVVIATAGTKESFLALKQALTMGLLDSTTHLTVLSVFEDSLGFSFSRMTELRQETLLTEFKELVTKPINAEIRDLFANRNEPPEIHEILRKGYAHEEIAKHLRDTPHDLLILGRRSFQAWPHLVRTRLAERLIPQLKIPVLICPENLEVNHESQGEICVATDLSRGSRQGEQLAIKLAKNLALPLRTLTIIPHEMDVAISVATRVGTFEQRYQQACQEALQATRDNIDRHFKYDRAHGMDINCDVRQGKIVPEICNSLAISPPRLLVMASHGRSGLDRLLLGSQTEKMLRRCPCPLLITKVRGPKLHEEDLP